MTVFFVIGNQKTFEGKDFAFAWHRYLKENPDYARILLANPLIEESLGDLSGKTVLDAGCGNGFFIPNILKKKPKLVYGLDISKYLIGLAKKEIKSEKVRFRIADLTKKIGFKDNFFDVIVSYNVLVDMPKIDLAFREMYRTLKPEGKAIVCIVHPLYNLFVNDKKAEMENVFARLRKYAKPEPISVNTIPRLENFVVYRRPLEQYVAIASEAGFRIRKIFPIVVSGEVGNKKEKYRERVGLPIFLFMELEK